MVTIGVLYVDIVGAFVNWRWISVACVGLTLIWSVLLLFIPESPGNYFSKQRKIINIFETLKYTLTAVVFRLKYNFFQLCFYGKVFCFFNCLQHL